MPLTYLSRRYAGMFYLRLRITTAKGRRRLLRFSLETRDRLEARRTLVAYLAWLFPMQTADDPATLFDTILQHARGFVLKGPARSRDELLHRVRFVDTAWMHHQDWVDSNPCPIREFRAFELQNEVHVTLVLLNEMAREDGSRLKIERLAVSSGRIASDLIASLCFDTATGRVRAYRPAEFRDLYEEGDDVEYGMRPGERSIYDVYLDDEGKRRTIQAIAPIELPQTPIAASAATASRRAPSPLRIEAEALGIDEPIKAVATGPRNSGTMLLSAARDDYLASRRVANGDGRADEDAGLVIDFLIAFVGDKPICAIESGDLHKFEIAMAQTPDRNGVPRTDIGSLMQRYRYGQAHGLDGLKMLSAKRIRNVWHRCLHQFFKHLRDKGRGTIDYKFDLVPHDPAPSVERDAWTEEEMIKLFSLPLFTGCDSKEQIWTPGKCFIQNDLYWAYLLIFFTGMRHSEIGTLKIVNVICEAGTWMFDLGTKARRTVTRKASTKSNAEETRRKSKASHRRVPIPRLLIDLGILSRLDDLKAAGVEALFPEWKPYRNRKSGRDMPGHHMSKSWQYVKAKFGFVGDELTLYGGRHTRAGWYDLINVPELVKRKLMGHAPRDAHEGYGFNALTVDEAQMALKELPIETQIAGILIMAKLRADYEELNVIRTW